MKYRRAACGLRLVAVLIATVIIAGGIDLYASTTVAEATKSGDAAAVKVLLTQGADVNAAQGGNTAVFVTADGVTVVAPRTRAGGRRFSPRLGAHAQALAA